MDTVAIYTRLSLDRDGTKTSTARQETDARALAKARGWKVSKVYRDNGISAYNGKSRASFEAMVRDFDAGRFDGILGWKVDRLGRRTADIVALLERLKARKGFLVTCDGLDTSTSNGKAFLTIASVFAEMESANTAQRVERSQLEAAQAGKPAGGGHRAFGYGPDGITIIESEAALIREAVDHVLAGGSLRSILHAWNGREIPTTTGRAWNGPPLRRMLMSARIAGLRTYKGEVIGRGTWPAIITADEHEQIVAVLTDPARRTSRPGAVRYLLSGMMFCGRCGAPVVASPHRGRRAYACRASQRGNGCGGVRILADQAEEHVAQVVLDALDSPALTRMRRAAARSDGRVGDLTRQLRRDERSLEDLASDFYVEHRISRAEFNRAHGALTKRIEETRGILSTETADRAVASFPSAGTELRAMWASADLAWRRQLLAAVVERITVGRARAAGQTDVGRVRVELRGTRPID